jgi:RNA polymerase sigma factor (sigma-70 family)
MPLRGDEAALFATLQPRLRRAVARAVTAPQAVIDDACANAWLILLRAQPRRETVYSWLRQVAIHEAIRLYRREVRDTAVPVDEMPSTTDRMHDALRALEALAALPARQRRMLSRQVAGLTYADIAREERVTARTVELQVLRGRRRLRDAAARYGTGR